MTKNEVYYKIFGSKAIDSREGTTLIKDVKWSELPRAQQVASNGCVGVGNFLNYKRVNKFPIKNIVSNIVITNNMFIRISCSKPHDDREITNIPQRSCYREHHRPRIFHAMKIISRQEGRQTCHRDIHIMSSRINSMLTFHFQNLIGHIVFLKHSNYYKICTIPSHK